MLGFGTALHAIAMLAVVVGLIAALGWALRRWGNGVNFGAGAKAVARYRITQRLPLSPSHTLIELETPHGATVLVLGPQGATEILGTEKHKILPQTAVKPTPKLKK